MKQRFGILNNVPIRLHSVSNEPTAILKWNYLLIKSPLWLQDFTGINF